MNFTASWWLTDGRCLLALLACVRRLYTQGAFAKVWKAYCAPKKTHVAIKIMDLEKITTSFEDIRVCSLWW